MVLLMVDLVCGLLTTVILILHSTDIE